MQDHKPLWGVKEVAVYLGVSERTALRLMAEVLPAVRIGKLWRIDPDRLREYLRQRELVK